jgi:uncharacterized protein
MTVRAVRRSLIRAAALGIAAAFALFAPMRAMAEPALWLVEGKDARVYMMGTVHLLPAGASWRSPRIDAAIAQASELWLELPDVDSFGSQVAVLFAIAGQGMSPKQPLSGRLTPQQYAQLEKVAKEAGLSARQLNPMRPWLAGMMIEAAEDQKTGAKTEPGVDVQLEHQFQQRGAPVKGFETIRQQIHVFSDLSEKDELAYLLETIKDSDDAGDSLSDLVKVWSAGDVSHIGKSDEEMKKETPALYDALVKKRNAGFADQIDGLLKGKGVYFIAVGAAHLAGPDSVQSFLKTKGLKVTRVNPPGTAD